MPSAAWGGRRRREILAGAAAIAVLAHGAVLLAVLEAGRHPKLFGEQLPRPDQPPVIEMIEDDAKYSGGSKQTPPASSAAAQPPSDRQDPAPPLTAPDSTVPPDAPPVSPAPKAPTQDHAPTSEQPQVELDPVDNGLGYGRQDDQRGVVPAAPDSHANKMPAYPRAAGRRGEEGSVQMLVRVNADGSVGRIDVAVSSGYPDLDATATKAVSNWHFRPARQNGVAVPTQMMQVFNYHIDR